MKYHRHKQTGKKNSTQEKKASDSFLSKETITAYTISTDAKGIGKLEDGSIVFVEELLPGEKALIKIHSQKSTYKRATVLNRENDSNYRATPPCPYYIECGGCQLQHIKQEKQIDFKIQWFFETLKRVGKWDALHCNMAEKRISIVFLKSDHYRRRVKFHFNGKNLGFHQSESHKIIDIQDCLIARPQLNEKISFLRKELSIVCPELQKKFNVHKLEFDIELTESDDEKVLLNFIHVPDQNIKLALQKHFLVHEDQLIHIKHPDIGKFKIKKESFIQPHFNSIHNYYHHISNCVQSFMQSAMKVTQTIHAWDLYAGSGIFSCIPFFQAAKLNMNVTSFAVEGVKESIDSLNINYKEIPIQSVLQDVHEFIEEQFTNLSTQKDFKKPNIIILDPPRSGVGIPNMQKIVELSAAESCILYLACDPASFARDTRILLEGGFHLKQIFLFDSFGQTNFYETLGYFSKGI